MNRWKPWLYAAVVLAALSLVICAITIPATFAPRPRKALNPEEPTDVVCDLWGRSFTLEQAQATQSSAQANMLAPSNGAVWMDDNVRELGKTTFYHETFGNEFVLTELLGVLDGPVNAVQFAKAIAALRGRGTTNLRVELAASATIGGRNFTKGTLIDTGIDVPEGSLVPLGLPVGKSGIRPQVGVTCALCHSTVDPVSMQVIHGAPNADLRIGLLAALAPNTSIFFAHAEVGNLDRFADPSPTIVGRDGATHALPNPKALEDAVDRVIMRWPPGSFDSMIDLQADPTQIPAAFTRGVQPFGWSGFATVGPFRGLSSLNNNVHGLNSDPLSNAELAPAIFNVDPEVYLGTLLQGASNSRLRYDPRSGRKPSAHLAAIDPTPATPAINEVVGLPHYPQGSLLSPTGLLTVKGGEMAWRRVNAMSAWQEALVPPRSSLDLKRFVKGREIFRYAGCATCHSGPAFSNGRIIAVNEIRTEPTRAAAFARFENLLTAPVVYGFDEKMLASPDAITVPVPTSHLDPAQVRLAMGWAGTGGGYRVAPLIGLAWSAPYLHDGGVAVGSDVAHQLGVTASFAHGRQPDPEHSLLALINRDLRRRVVETNRADPEMQIVRVTGEGHEFWVDEEAGFAPDSVRALLYFLLHLSPPSP